VLTDKGWKLHQDIKDEKIAVYDPKTDTIRFEKPLRLYAYDYEGPMYHFKSKAVDVLVTPEHKMLFKTHNSPKWQVERAENLLGNVVFKSIVKSALPSIKITEKTVREISKVKYKGKVYCFATSTGFYVTMRNGKPAIQGNTAEVVMQEYVTRLRMMQEIIGDTLETVLFKQLIKDEFGEGVEIPKIKWKPIWEPTFQDKAKVLGDLVDKGIILPKEARIQLGFPEEYPITTPEELQAVLRRNGVKP
jgi:YHS domain-containing protein